MYYGYYPRSSWTKMPNHTHLRDGNHFAFESVGGMTSNSGTRCIRCGYTKALYKPQR